MQLKNGAGTNLTTSGGTVALSTTAGTLSAVTDNNNGTYTATLTAPTTVGTATVSGTINGQAITDTENVSFVPGPAAKIVIVTQPSSTAQNGVAFAQQPAVRLRDANDNDVSQTGVTVTAAIASGGGTLGGTVTANTNASGIATFTNLAITGTIGDRTISFSASGLSPAVSSTITITPGAAAQLAVTTQPSSTAQAGVAFPQQPVIRVQDASGNNVAQAGVTVTAAIASGGGTLGGTSTATSDASGAATFTNLSIGGTAGNRTLSFSSAPLTSATSNTINLTAGAAAAVTFSAQPSNVVASAAITPAVQLSIVDSFGNVVTSATGNVTVAIGTNPSGGTLGGTTTVAASAGVATFSNLSINLVGSGYTLTASSGSLTGATSGSFNVTHGPLDHFLVEAAGGGPIPNQLAGTPFNVRVTAQDSFNNTVTSFTGTVTFTSTPAGGISAGATSGAFTAGVLSSHSITFSASGTFTLTATNGAGAQSGTSGSFQVQAPPTAVNDGPAGGSAPGQPFHAFFSTAASPQTFNLAASGVLANDSLGFPAATITSFGGDSLGGSVTTYAAGSTVSPLPGAGVTTGSISVGADGSVTFRPADDFTGNFVFRYRLTNARGTSDGQVTIAVGVRPSAGNDTYSPTLVGNVPVNTATSTQFKISANDAGDALTHAITGETNGTATINADKTFTFRPTAGFNGAASFTYTVTNGFGTSAAATVSLTVGTPIWFINAAAGAGDGRFDAPFNAVASLAAINNGAGNNPATGDSIFLYSGTYTGPLTLLNSQRLIGQGATSSLSSIAGVTWPADSGAEPSMGGAAPVVGAAGATAITLNGVGVAGTNVLRGFNFGNVGAAGTALAGTSFGTLTISEVNFATDGRALLLSTGSVGTATVGNLSTTGGINAMALTTVSGTLNISSGSMTGATNATVVISGGSVGGTWAGSFSHANGSPAFDIGNGHTGALVFSGTVAASAGSGLLFSNADGSYNFSGAATLSGGAGIDILPGVDVTNGSQGTFTWDADSSIGNTTGQLVDIQGSKPTFTYSGTFTKTNAGVGINLDGNQGGTITFNGSGTKSINVNSGTSHALNMNNNDNCVISFSGNNLTLTAQTGDAFRATAGGTVTLSGTGNTAQSTGGAAVRVDATTIGAAGVTFQSTNATGGANGIVLLSTGSLGGLTVQGSGTTASSGGTIQSTTGAAISLNATHNPTLRLLNIRPNNDGVRATNVTGTLQLDRSTVDYLDQNIAGTYAFRAEQTNTNATITLDAVTFRQKQDGTTAVSMSSMGNSVIAFNVIDSNTGDAFTSRYEDLFGSGVVVGAGDTAGSTSFVTATISNTTFTTAPSNGLTNLEMGVTQNATLVPIIQNNTFDRVALPLATVGVINLNASVAGRVGSNASSGLITNNTISNIRSGAGPTFAYDPAGTNGYLGIRVAIDNDAAGVNHKLQITNNSITQVARQGLLISARGAANNVNVLVQGNTIGTLAAPVGTPSGRRGVEIEAQSTALLKVLLNANPSIVGGTTGANSALQIRSGVDGGSGGNSTIHATVTGNTIANPDGATNDGRFRAETIALQNGTMCLDLRSNLLESGAKQFQLNNNAGTFNRNESGNTGTITTIGAVGAVAGCTQPTF